MIYDDDSGSTPDVFTFNPGSQSSKGFTDSVGFQDNVPNCEQLN